MKLENQILLTLNNPNKNGRVYSTEVIQQMLDNCVNEPILGELASIELYADLNSIEYQTVDTSKVSHRIDNVRIEGDNLIGDVTILKTPMGITLIDILTNIGLEYGGFRPRMRGVASLIDNVPTITECKLISVDYVNDPA
jgi:hypothetical protein